MRKFKTVPVDPTGLYFYQIRADECHRLANYAHSHRLWFGTCINAVHSAIALADCTSVFLRRIRYAGTSHDEAVEFYSTLQIDKPAFRQSIQKLGSILSIKNHAEYADQLLTENNASLVLKHLDRLKEFVLTVIPHEKKYNPTKND